MPLGSGQVNWNSRRMITASSRLRLLENSFRVLERRLHWELDLADAVKSIGLFDGNVRGKDGNLGGVNLGLCQFVFDSHGTLGFDFDGVAKFLGRFLELLGGHVSMGNAGGTSGDGDDFHGCVKRAEMVRFFVKTLIGVESFMLSRARATALVFR